VKTLRFWPVAAVLIGAGGCSLFVPVSDYDSQTDRPASGGGGGAGGAAGASGTLAAGGGGVSGAGTGGAPAGGSAGSSGASMCPVNAGITVPRPAGGTTLIDRTEVTRCQYEAFLAATSDGSAVGVEGLAECSWNTTYLPPPGCMAVSEVFQGAGSSDHPQPCIDWCDAYAYCKWAGKHLCGSLSGGPVAFSGFSDPAQSEWSNACQSGSAMNAFPYGNSCVSGVCNGSCSATSGTTVAAGSLPGCSASGAYAGVLDLSGNLWEWIDACNATSGATDACRRVGGSFNNSEANLACVGSNTDDARSLTDSGIGFRCCGG
jgi:formylglycine-generating enzyme